MIKAKFMPIELNEKFKEALEIMENSKKSVFVTGRAGTGKSTLLEYFRAHSKKNLAVLAPTGVAAVNVGGQTIHSFFRFKPNITPDGAAKKTSKRIYKKLDALVIDEISMVRADLLDCVDRFLRVNGKNKNKSFGGVQMILIGDLYQLPPVVTGNERHIFKTEYASEYFFDAKVFQAGEFAPTFLELEKIYRQKDDKFISILNSIRNNIAGEKELEELNCRHLPGFERKADDFYIHLTPTNRVSGEINKKELEKLIGKKFCYHGKISGRFEQNNFPAEENLEVKIGAQIMFLNNDRMKRWVNGTIGKIIAIENDEEENEVIGVELQTGEIVEVAPHTWEIFEYFFDERKKKIKSRTVGSFTQYPLKLAWSVTIHKSQGKTFNRVIIDIDRGTFAHGQIYVALSRCTSLQGIVLKKKILKKHIWLDWRVVKFITGYQYGASEKEVTLERKIEILGEAAKNKTKLEIIYLKSSDVKSRRVVLPKKIGRMRYMKKEFLGVIAYCFSKGDERVFRIDRILKIKEV